VPRACHLHAAGTFREIPQRTGYIKDHRHGYFPEDRFAGEFADFVHRADVRMAQRGSGARLVQHRFRVDFATLARSATTFRATSRSSISSCAPIQHAHASLADLGENAIVPEQLADHVVLFLAPQRYHAPPDGVICSRAVRRPL